MPVIRNPRAAHRAVQNYSLGSSAVELSDTDVHQLAAFELGTHKKRLAPHKDYSNGASALAGRKIAATHIHGGTP